jgi:hypothetical protein
MGWHKSPPVESNNNGQRVKARHNARAYGLLIGQARQLTQPQYNTILHSARKSDFGSERRINTQQQCTKSKNSERTYLILDGYYCFALVRLVSKRQTSTIDRKREWSCLVCFYDEESRLLFLL